MGISCNTAVGVAVESAPLAWRWAGRRLYGACGITTSPAQAE